MKRILRLLLISLLCTGLLNVNVYADNTNNDCTSQNNPCEINADSELLISADYTIGDKSKIVIHKSGDETTNYYAGSSTSGGTLVEIRDKENNAFAIYPRGECSGLYIVSIEDNSVTPQTHVYYVNVTPGSGGGSHSSAGQTPRICRTT